MAQKLSRNLLTNSMFLITFLKFFNEFVPEKVVKLTVEITKRKYHIPKRSNLLVSELTMNI